MVVLGSAGVDLPPRLGPARPAQRTDSVGVSRGPGGDGTPRGWYEERCESG